MAIESQVQLLLSGVQAWNAWRLNNPNDSIDLSDAYLDDAMISGANLADANLSEASLYGAFAVGSCFDRANLNGACLSQANLAGSSFRGASLIQATFGESFLVASRFERSRISESSFDGSILSGSQIHDCTLYDVDFSYADLKCSDLRNLSVSYSCFVAAIFTGAAQENLTLSTIDFSHSIFEQDFFNSARKESLSFENSHQPESLIYGYPYYERHETWLVGNGDALYKVSNQSWVDAGLDFPEYDYELDHFIQSNELLWRKQQVPYSFLSRKRYKGILLDRYVVDLEMDHSPL